MGKFITFEGIDGSGKSTQAELFKKYLVGREIDTVLFREPGSTPIGNMIRSILLDVENEMDELTETLLFFAARRELTHHILDALAKGKIVICDRFIDSTIAYQGFGRNVSLALISHIQEAVVSRLPDLTFVFDIDPAEGLRRSMGREANTDLRFEMEDLSFHNNVRSGYKHIITMKPKRYIMICVDSKTPEQVHNEVVEAFLQKALL